MSLVKAAQSSHLDGFKMSPQELQELLNDDSLREDVGELQMEVTLEPDDSEESDLLNELNVDVIVDGDHATDEVHDGDSEEMIVESDGEDSTGEDDIVVEEKLQDENADNDGQVFVKEYKFKLDHVPGGDDQDDIIIPDEEEIVEEIGPWGWKLSSFPEWLQDKMMNVPKHSGKDTVGLERAISYLKKVNTEISKAISNDVDGLLPVDQIESAREELLDGIDRLEDRLEKVHSAKYPKKGKGKKKKADDESSEIIKEAGSARFNVNVSLLISGIVRTCINSAVSAGHDLTDSFKKLAKEYDLDKREVFEATQLLIDMGYPIHLDRGLIGKDIDLTSSNNFDFASNRPV